MLIPGKRAQGLIITCLIGIAGALLGGWAATKLFHVHTLGGLGSPAGSRVPGLMDSGSEDSWLPGAGVRSM